MSKMSDRMKKAMDIRGMKQVDLCEHTGIGKSSISTYLSGEYEPKQRNLFKIAEALQVNVAWLMGKDDVPMEGGLNEGNSFVGVENLLPIKRRKIPLLGNVAAGQPIWADESHEEYVLDNGDVPCDYALKVIGDSMEPLLYDGDIVFVKQQPDVQDGQIAVVLVEDSATLKVLYHIPEGIQLVSKNSAYAPMIYAGLRASAVRVLGLAVQYTRILI
ncbi:MAG: helix-turn-helix domain-containing protein [Clostridiales bacterium]|nr:helix-turn-helix domain-containing protein [Clostridiales bacterium]